MSPFAANTIGEPNEDGPRTEDAFWETVVYTCCVMGRNSVHLNTSRSESRLWSVCDSRKSPPDDPVCKFEKDDMRDMEEKCDGEGDIRWEFSVVPLPFEDSRGACGMFDLSRDTVGCKKDRAILEGVPCFVGDPTLRGVPSPNEDVDGVWSEDMSACYRQI